MSMNEKIRAAEAVAKKIAAENLSRGELEQKHGEVWTRAELEERFAVLFEGLWPIIVVRRLSDGARGVVMNQERPNLYFGFFQSPTARQ